MAAELQSNIEASLFKYLKDNLPSDHLILESPYLHDLAGKDKWVVITPLTGFLGIQPKLLLFLHCGVKNKDKAASMELAKLIDRMIPLFEEGQPISIYDTVSNLEVGKMRVTAPSLSPVLEHAGGGLKRSLTISVTYTGN